MCLLIHQPRGVSFSKADLNDYLQCNPDGFGAVYAERGELHVIRHVNNDKAVIHSYYECLAGRHAMLHFRMATHGSTGLSNCHPFFLTPEIVVAHNGILRVPMGAKETRSDTVLFAERVLAPIARDDRDALFQPDMLAMLEHMVGLSNRLMFFRADGKVAIVNETQGVRHKKAWLSNTYAWSSPESEWARYRRYAAADVSDANDTPPVLTAVADDTPPARNMEETIWDVWQDWMDGGEESVRLWVAAEPHDAAAVLAEYYMLSDAQAIQLIVSDPARAVTWICDRLALEK